jgi:hypothetical protein
MIIRGLARADVELNGYRGSRRLGAPVCLASRMESDTLRLTYRGGVRRVSMLAQMLEEQGVSVQYATPRETRDMTEAAAIVAVVSISDRKHPRHSGGCAEVQAEVRRGCSNRRSARVKAVPGGATCGCRSAVRRREDHTRRARSPENPHPQRTLETAESPDYPRALRADDHIRVRMLRIRLFRTAHDEEVRFVSLPRNSISHSPRGQIAAPASQTMALASANVIATISPCGASEASRAASGCCVRHEPVSDTPYLMSRPCESDGAEHSGGWCAGWLRQG